MIDWEIVKSIATIGGVVSILIAACKFNFKFDINEWQKRKDGLRKIKMQNLCPHLLIEKVDDKLAYQDMHISPSGTDQWVCQKCSHISHASLSKSQIKFWLDNPKEYGKHMKKWKKLMKKMGVI